MQALVKLGFEYSTSTLTFVYKMDKDNSIYTIWSTTNKVLYYDAIYFLKELKNFIFI